MAKAACDVLAVLPAPAVKANAGCADLLEDQLFAYGCSSSIVITEVHQLQLQAVLFGEHRNSAVTAVKWAPDCHSRDLKASSYLRLASGDSEGHVVVWDVTTQCPLVHLSERFIDGGATGMSSGGGVGGGVVGLQWVLSQPCLLAVMQSQGTLMIWDTRGGTLVWQKEVLSGEVCCCLTRDPLNSIRLAVCGVAGSVSVITLSDLQAGKADVAQYRVNVMQPAEMGRNQSQVGQGNSPVPPAIQATFGHTRDLLFLTTAREIIIYDLELGLQAGCIGLAKSRPSFCSLLGVYGRGVSRGLGDEGGTDILYAAHVDGAMSVWHRAPGELKFSSAGWFRLTPPAVRGAGIPVSLLAARAQMYPEAMGNSPHAQVLRSACAANEDLARALRSVLLPDRVTPDATGGRDIFGGVVNVSSKSFAGVSDGGAGGQVGGPPASPDLQVGVISVTSDGRLWKWTAPLPAFTTPQEPRSTVTRDPADVGSAAPPAAVCPAPTLTAISQLLPHPVTSAAIFPQPVLVNTATLASHTFRARSRPGSSAGMPSGAAPAPGSQPGASPFSAEAMAGLGEAKQGAGEDQVVGEVVMLGAALSIHGQLQVFTVQQGQASPVSIQLCLSLSVHKESSYARTLRWLGATPRIISFSAERTAPASGGGSIGGAMSDLGGDRASATNWRNSLAITDLRNRRSTPFREVASEPHRLVDLRASPSGFHVLLRFHEAPTELWAVGVEPPIKLMSLDVDWSAPTWMGTADPTHTKLMRLSDILSPSSVPGLTTRSPSTTHSTIPAPPSPCTPPGLPRYPSQPQGQAKPTDKEQQEAEPGSQPSVAPLPVPYKNPTSPWQAAVNSATAAAPEEMVVYTYESGLKCGVLRIRGRSVVNDDRVKRPRLAPEEAPRFFATAMAGWGQVVVMGDPEGRIAVWSTATGAVSLIYTGCGVVRRLALAPPPHSSLYTAPDKASTIVARVAAVFGDGTFGLYELGPRGMLRPSHCSPLVTARIIGRASDLSWLPLPCDGGGGSMLMVITDTGSLSVIDVSQAVDRRPNHAYRMSALRNLLGTPQPLHPDQSTASRAGSAKTGGIAADVDLLGDEVTPDTPVTPSPAAPAQSGMTAVVLAPPPPVACSLLMHRPWMLLLRLLLQLNLPTQALKALAEPRDSGAGGASKTETLAEAIDELLAVFPTTTHKALLRALSGGQPGGLSSQGSAEAGTLLKPAAAAVAGSSEGAMSADDLLSGPAAGTPPASAGAEGGSAGASAAGSVFMRAMSDAYQLAKSSTQSLVGGGAGGGAGGEAGPTARRTLSRGDSAGATAAPDLPGLLKHLARRRAGGQLLHPSEWDDYTASLARASQLSTRKSGGASGAEESSSVARVAALCGCCSVAARAAADLEEARFWAHLPASLQAVKELQDGVAPYHDHTSLYQAPGTGAAPAPGRALHVHPAEAPAPLRVPTTSSTPEEQAARRRRQGVRLWDENATLVDAQERALWHESMARSQYATNEDLQQRRMLEYVVLGDFQTAVAFLLASEPQACTRYYRDALVTAALAAAANVKPGAGARKVGTPLQLKAAKVLSAHAASIGDVLLGVPLHCSAGLYADAVALLQECGHWRYAANLVAHSLTGAERGVALHKWAEEVAVRDGSLWRAAGILVAAGCCRETLRLLQASGRPDSAASFLAACHLAGLTQTVAKPQAAGEEGQEAAAGTGPGSGNGRSSLEGKPPLGKRLSLSKGEILQQQANKPPHTSSTRSSFETAVGGHDKTLSDALASAKSAPSSCTHVFSILGVGAQESSVSDAHDDVGPVQLQFERFVNDLLLHM